MKIAIIGAGGLLGQELGACLRGRGESVFPLGRDELDVTKPETIRKALCRLVPDVIINCAVIISVDQCEENSDLAYAVNRDGVKNLLEASTALPRPPLFVQISSSEVFGGWNEGSYKIEGYGEDDERQPISVYQKSKAEAEDIVAAFAAGHPTALKSWYVVRASWLYGDGRETFVEQFIRMMKNDEEIKVAADQWRSPTWTHDFASALADLISGNRPGGIYHIANEVAPGEATVMDVVEEIRRHLGITPEGVKLKLVSRKDFFKVPRAPSNVLLNTKLPKLRPWREALKEYLNLRYPAKTL